MTTFNATYDVDLTLGDASSAITTTNFLQPNAYKLTINRKNFPNLEFFCQSVFHPEMTANPAELPYKNVSNVPVPGDKLTFGELTCMIILDENMNSYIEMYKWLSRIVQTNYKTNFNGASGSNNITAQPPTHADVTLSILSSANNVTRKIRYIDCIPVSLGNINFESTAGTDNVITYPAGFRYTYFEFI
jgi:hypothetical protein|tara:strand:+ start:579 stop:1145 length:567 start_codon:yes stop_codon:yes gene_type:complete